MTPAETQILDVILLRLQNITTANGYSLDIKKFERGRLEPFKDGDIPAINYWPTSHQIENTEYGDDAHTLRIVVDVRAKIASKKDGNFPDMAGKMIADVVTALQRDPSTPAVSDDPDCELAETVTSMSMPSHGYQIGPGQSPWVGAVIEVEIEWKSPLGDMFTYEP